MFRSTLARLLALPAVAIAAVLLLSPAQAFASPRSGTAPSAHRSHGHRAHHRHHRTRHHHHANHHHRAGASHRK